MIRALFSVQFIIENGKISPAKVAPHKRINRVFWIITFDHSEIKKNSNAN